MKILKKLIQIASPSGREEKLAEFLVDYFVKLGITPILYEGNVFVHIKGKKKTCALIYNAHMDTVSAGDALLWKYPPLQATHKNGRIYGLGASDDKAGVTSFCLLAKQLVSHKPACDVWLTFVTQEETTSIGTKSFLSYFLSKYKKRYKKITAIVAEATDNKFLEIGHRGSIKLTITTTGNAGHSSRPQEIKQHAIEKTIEVIAAIQTLEKNLQKTHADPVFGNLTCALTGIYSSESSLNKIPNSCSTTWDIRTNQFTHTIIVALIKKTLKKKAVVKLINKISHPPIRVDSKEEIITIIRKIHPTVKLSISPGANDTCKFTQAGIPAISFGPGTKKVIHKENEYVILKNINKAVSIYKKVIDAFGL